MQQLIASLRQDGGLLQTLLSNSVAPILNPVSQTGLRILRVGDSPILNPPLKLALNSILTKGGRSYHGGRRPTPTAPYLPSPTQ